MAGRSFSCSDRWTIKVPACSKDASNQNPKPCMCPMPGLGTRRSSPGSEGTIGGLFNQNRDF